MTIGIVGWVRRNLKSVRDWGIFLTALVPVSLALGRAPADVCVIGVSVLFLFDSARNRRWDWLKRPWIVAALGLWIYSIVRAAFVPGNISGLNVAVVWVRYIVFAASVGEWTVAEDRGRTWLLRSAAAAIAFLSLDGLLQYVSGHDITGRAVFENNRLTGPYSRPILGFTIASLMAAPLFWLLERRRFLWAFLLADLSFAAVFLSGDRMGFLWASVIMLTWLFFFILRGGIRQWSYAAMALGLLAVLVVGMPRFSAHTLTQAPGERQVSSTINTLGSFASTPYGLVWKSGLDVAMDNFFFGVGMRRFRVACFDEKFG
ncbi:MAG: hypothetical protein PHE27_09115, partial [Alphaproteobacteria bacterium]|nr:hypothetical protein [Alphaproteobacteria bacterium]